MTETTYNTYPDALYRIAPALRTIRDENLYGTVWQRPALSIRDRCLITVATLIALGHNEPLADHVARALDNGLSPVEISETLTQLAFYSGWPTVVCATPEIHRVFEERGITIDPEPDLDPLEPDPEMSAACQEMVDTNVRPFIPGLADDTENVLFGNLWLRPHLGLRDRSLVTMVALIAIGQNEQLPLHFRKALNHGLSFSEAGEVISHVAWYTGWPRAFAAVPAMQKVLRSNELHQDEGIG